MELGAFEQHLINNKFDLQASFSRRRWNDTPLFPSEDLEQKLQDFADMLSISTLADHVSTQPLGRGDIWESTHRLRAPLERPSGAVQALHGTLPNFVPNILRKKRLLLGPSTDTRNQHKVFVFDRDKTDKGGDSKAWSYALYMEVQPGLFLAVALVVWTASHEPLRVDQWSVGDATVDSLILRCATKRAFEVGTKFYPSSCVSPWMTAQENEATKEREADKERDAKEKKARIRTIELGAGEKQRGYEKKRREAGEKGEKDATAKEEKAMEENARVEAEEKQRRDEKKRDAEERDKKDREEKQSRTDEKDENAREEKTASRRVEQDLQRLMTWIEEVVRNPQATWDPHHHWESWESVCATRLTEGPQRGGYLAHAAFFRSNSLNTTLVKQILEHTPDMNAQNHRGQTLAHIATAHKRLDLLEAIHARGADFHIATFPTDKHERGQLCMDICVHNGNARITAFLDGLKVRRPWKLHTPSKTT